MNRNSSVLVKRINIATALLKEGKFNLILKGLGLRFYSNINSFGLRRDLHETFNNPKAKINLVIRPFKAEDMSALKESHRHERLVMENIPNCYVAVTDDNKPCYRQWLIGAIHNHRIQEYFGNLFPKLNENEALLEGAFTHPDYRGMGIMPAAMANIAEKGHDLNAKWIITFVAINNIPSLKGCKRSGFEPYILRHESWFCFKRSIKFKEIPAKYQKLYAEYTS